MKLVSWNVNGIRACIGKGFPQVLADSGADVYCVQETKAQPDQVDTGFASDLGYEHIYWNSAEKKGYSGVAVFCKEEPLSVSAGLDGRIDSDNEGRVLALEFEEFTVITVYTPNSQNKLKRLDYRMEWDRAFAEYLAAKAAEKPVLVCGDLNVAHEEIDLARPAANRKNSGFSDEERGGLSHILSQGFVDTFRHFHPEKAEAYSWWSFRAGARGRNVGWRIDYWLASDSLVPRLKSASIQPEIEGSDHCPVVLEIS